MFAVLGAASGPSLAAPDDDRDWQLLTPVGQDPEARHESGLAAAGGKLWLLGGRGERPVQVFDPDSRSWRTVGAMPAAVHHFQPAVIGTKIYLLGAMSGDYPDEDSVATIHVLDTVTETWSTAGQVPAARRRGGAATAVRDGWIYVIGGNTLGHNGGAVGWLDRWRPSDGSWESLADAPNARDHFMAAFIDDLLVATAGRASTHPNVFGNMVGATDIYDPVSGDWVSVADIPTPRAGALAGVWQHELIVAGGESTSSSSALAVTQAFNVRDLSWRTLRPLAVGRHSGGGAVLGDRFHVVAGSPVRGGGETPVHEYLELISIRDSDGDGLTDEDERDVHSTDPTLADSDGDTLGDGAEIDIGTDPNLADSDADGLHDASEIAGPTDPLDADSDDDGLDDGSEVALGTDPLVADTDGDTLPDGDEVSVHGTDPLNADSDDDGLDDGTEYRQGTDPLIPDTDADGLEDAVEGVLGTDPLLVDTDGDTLGDGDEVALGTDPLDPDSNGSADGMDGAPTDPQRVRTGGGGSSDLVLLLVFGFLTLLRRRSLAPRTLN